MTAPSTAREALLAEAIGELAPLLERVEAVQRSIEASERALLKASGEIDARLRTFSVELEAVTQRAKVRTLEHVARHVHAVGTQAGEVQADAMREAARIAFAARLDPTLDRLGAALLRLVERLERPWDRWLAHAASAAGGAALAWAIGAAFGVHR